MADPTEVEESEHEVQPPAKNWRKELEDQAKQARAEADEAKRELAFTRAGLTELSDKQVRALLATHEGEITADAIKATANELGFVKQAGTATEEVDPEQEQRTEELGHLNRFAGSPASSGAADPAASLQKGIEDFDGDYQQFVTYVMDNASSILPPRT
jgi:hypothetical protein